MSEESPKKASNQSPRHKLLPSTLSFDRQSPTKQSRSSDDGKGSGVIQFQPSPSKIKHLPLTQTSKYLVDLNEPEFILTSNKYNQPRDVTIEFKGMDQEAAEERQHRIGDIEPKVFLPHKRRDDLPPREVEVERKRRLYSTTSVAQVVQKALLDLHATPLYEIAKSDPTALSMGVLKQLATYLYDDTMFEIHEPEDWIQLGRKSDGSVAIPVTACITPADGQSWWTEGHVTGYEKSTELFTVKYVSETTKLVEKVSLRRLDVCFKSEDPFEFAQRIVNAHLNKLLSQIVIRKNLYIDCMPTDDLSQLGTQISDKIMAMAMAPVRKLYTSLPNSNAIISEIQLDYLRTMNKIILEKNSSNPDLKHIFDYLPLSQPNAVTPKSRGTAVAKEIIPKVDYADQFMGFSFQTFLTCPEALRAIQRVNDECVRLRSHILFQVKITRSMKLEEFQQFQGAHQRNIYRLLHEEWPNRVSQSIKTALERVGKGWYNLNETQRDTYEFSKLKILLRRANFMMQDTLQYVIMDSVESYQSFLTNSTLGTVHVDDNPNKTIVSYPDLDKDKEKLGEMKWEHLCRQRALQRHPPVFSLSVAISQEKRVLNQTEVDKRKAEIDNWKPSLQEDTTAVPETPPIPIEPIEGYVFGYNIPITACTDGVLDVFDKAFDSIKNIQQVEQMVMDKLFWSSKPSLTYVSATEPWVVDLRSKIETMLKKAEVPLQQYLNTYRKYQDFVNLDEDAYLNTFRQQVPLSLSKLSEAIRYNYNQVTEIENSIPNEPTHLGLYMVNCSDIKSFLMNKYENLAKKLLQWHLDGCLDQAKELQQEYNQIQRQLQKIPSDIEQLTEMSDYINTIPSLLEPLSASSAQLIQHRKIFDTFHYSLYKEDFMTIWRTRQCPLLIQAQLKALNGIMNVQKSEFSGEMKEQQVAFAEHLRSLQSEVDGFKKYGDLARVDQIYANVMSLEARLQKVEEDARLFNSREVLFNQVMTDYDQIARTKREFEPYYSLWKTAHSWIKEHAQWMNGPFKRVQGEAMEAFVDTNWSTIVKTVKYFEKADIKGCADVAGQIKSEIASFRPHVPLIMALRNPGMQDRHWEKLNNEFHISFRPDDTIKLSDVLDLGLENHLENITKISEAAGKEYQIEKALDQMLNQWKSVSLQIDDYRETGTYILKGVDTIGAILDEQIMMTQAMQFSAFKKPFEERINQWEKTLSTVSEVLDEWMQVQRGWLYLQPIFESPDINKQLPTEGKRFATVDKNWRATLQGAKAKPNVIQFCNNEKLLEKFQDSNKFLELVQKGLSDYLETKRSAFSRFYFLSNDELLSILSESKDPQLVQPHLKKCFEGVVKVEFQEDLSITAMISAENEQVTLSTPIDPTHKNVENWMTEVESMMRITVRDVMYQAIQDYTQVPRVQWIQKWPGMCVLNGSQFHWTKEMEEKMAAKGRDGVKEMMENQLAQLADMIVMVRGPLEKMARITVGALTVIDVHARDVTAKLKHDGVSQKEDFQWSSQLRYYWTDHELVAEMVTAKRAYGYEYLGNSFRLVITPLTDKCYMTLMAALQMVLGGAPAGPAGTGKTETTKDLAKALAKQCVVFNCSDGLDYIAMGKFFKGLAACGAWACFDEFNRINIEVLSVIGQQITTIQLAIRAGDAQIFFEGSEIVVSSQFGVFITMNPGYAGRSDLPDSLAALFRPVAMMVPDYAMIGEIMFFAYGYEKAKECGKKMVTTFKLCSEQLSSQSHYDYGMRAVKTVITAAGNLKRVDPDMDEEVLLLRALQDVNLPKFLAQDLPLFDGIISDLFPGKCRPQLNLGALLREIKMSVQKLHLQPHPVFLTKVVQLYETLSVRHGLMVVGATGGGKSSNIQVLAHTLTRLKELNEKGFAYEKTIIHQLNPKSITMGQLYGEFDPNTHEWQDGILSTLYRTAALCTKPDRKWVLFDGPVDAIWIENMNTVLDDNKKLCLNSGEIIQMSAEMTMMFEVEDLSVASPATVSRTGMVYMEPTSMGFDPLIRSWLDALPQELSIDFAKSLQLLFDVYFLPSLRFVAANVQCLLLPPIENNLLQSLLRFMDCFIQNVYEVDSALGSSKTLSTDQIVLMHSMVEDWFIFSLVWSVGGTFDGTGRIKFNAFLRGELIACNSSVCIPTEGTVYDYNFVQETKSWIPWLSTLASIPDIDVGVSFSEISVPTTDSVRNLYLLGLTLPHNKHVMMVGPTGTGKTVNINQFLENLDADKYVPLKLSFSAQTSANQTQDFFDSKMEKRRKGVYGPPAGKTFVVYVDDLNMPKQEAYFAQPPIEILRQWFDQNGWYDRKQLVFRNIIDVVFVTSMGPPGGGRNPITPRFVRHFNVVSYTEMSDQSKGLIFSRILGSFLSKFHEHVNLPHIIDGVVSSSIAIYNTIMNELLPTPAKSHYTFNLRDLAKVFQGMLMGDAKKIATPTQLLRLWIHENQRVFKDRLTNPTDHAWFQSLLANQLHRTFSETIQVTRDRSTSIPPAQAIYETIVPTEDLFYGDFMIPGAEPKIYEEINDLTALVAMAEEYLSDYNTEASSPMNLVLFRNAIEHVCRISRIIRQPQGNALLLGVGGSGRQSLTKLATFMADYICFQVEIAKGYGIPEWRDDLKKCLMMAGLEKKQVVFLFSDVQIVNETMLEDVNSILNSGDVPTIYGPEDLEQIMGSCRSLCVAKQIPATKLNIFAQYVVQVRQNLHTVLCMSPLGSTFRDRLRMFPSLVNCCTIDWFSEWPAEALHSVALNALTSQNLQLGDHLESVVTVFQKIHQSVELQSIDFFQKLRRHNHVTPTSYLELLSTFKSVLELKRDETQSMRHRLQNGVDKIAQTKSMVAGMQEQLVALKPQLQRTQEEVEEMMAQITTDKSAADETKLVVEKEEQVANKKAAETRAIADDAQRDLDEALPALDEAVQCLNKLKKSDIDEVKAMKNPPHGVKLTMEAACIIFGIKPVMKTDPEKPGQKIKDFWESAQKTILSNAKKLLDDMMNFDKDNIPEKIVTQVEPYMESEDFSPAAVRKASVACEAICMWVRAMYTYYNVAKMVEPKKKALAEAQAELDVTLAILADAKGRLAAVVARLVELEVTYGAAVVKKDQLANDVMQCEVRLASALKLIHLLGGEEARWKATVHQLDVNFQHLVGDVVVSAGTISYLGAFTLEVRDACLLTWYDALRGSNVPFTKGCNVTGTLADPVRVRAWQLAGLPSDAVSIQNGIIMARARRWPLLIDPQGQANRFIKNLGKETSDNGMDVVKMTDKGCVKTLENGIRFGKWILLENIDEQLDPILEPILLQTKVKQGGQLMMKVGDSTIPYNNSFRFYMTTKLPNPHYPPETCVKVSLLNFTITPNGLEEQALAVVVQEEMPELAEKKNSLMINNARMKAELVEIENKILYMLANSKGNILDDTELIDTLGKAKITSEDINEKMAEAEITEKAIDGIREQYRGVAYRSSLLFFCVSNLSGIDPMYQYSLTWFVDLFIKGIRSAEPANELTQRLKNLNDFFTYSLYKNVCRSLFESHKMLFSFLMTIKILQGDKLIDAVQWRFLISGTSPNGEISLKNPDSRWIEDRLWNEVCRLSTIADFEDLGSSFYKFPTEWKAIFDSNEPHLKNLPGSLNEELNSFKKLCVLRCLRPDKMTEAIQLFVAEQMGQKFIEPPAFDLAGAYNDSGVLTPLVFILSTGSDPAKDLWTFAETMKMSRKLNSISLGQGQGKIAARMIVEATANGKWVLLQNCHLAVSWMPALEKICEDFDLDTVHRDFRLWLTSKPCQEFPTSVLQNGVKMTKEPPKGIRANLKNTYIKMTSELLDATSKPKEYKKLLFGLSFFHAVIIERKKFGPLGWNIPYAFNDTDYDISRAQLEMFLDFYDEVPYKVLCVMTSVVNYGGRVTDDKDMRTIDVILDGFFNDNILSDDFKFSASGLYYSIPFQNSDPHKSYMDYIESLPINPEPEAFGMHSNANITCDMTETFNTFDIILSLQPRASAGTGKSREDIIEELAQSYQLRLPDLFDEEQLRMMYPIMYEESMNTVFGQEVKRYNSLLKVMKSTLPVLRKALKGLVVMSNDLEAMANCIFDQKVPPMWERKAYPSLKALGPWVEELLQRLDFMASWGKNGTPHVFWLSGFFFPQGFLTGILQNHSRTHSVPIDKLSYDFIMAKETIKEITCKPRKGGCYITGLFLQGATWSKEKQSLEDPVPKELFSKMPLIHLLPVEDRQATKEGIYRCPVYKILTRTGTLSTTGHSTNFVCWIEIPSNKRTIYRNSLVSETNVQMKFADQDYWIRAGVACFLSLQY